MKIWIWIPLLLIGIVMALIFHFSSPPSISSSKPHQSYSSDDLKFKARQVQDHYYKGFGGTKNYYSKIENLQNKINQPLILITGLEDITENWWATAKEALDRGFQHIYVVEIRGQGRSERAPGNSNHSAHVHKFSAYVEDMIRAIQAIDKEFGPPSQPPLVIAHSTGTLVYAASLPRIRAEIPQWEPEKISFWTPLIKPKVTPLLNNPIVKPILSGLDQLAASMGRTLLGKTFQPRPFAENKLTNSKPKHEWSEGIRYSENLNSSGVSLRWALETFATADQLLEENYNVLTQPCLVFIATEDQVVRNDWTINNPNFSIIKLTDAKHALHIEGDAVFQKVVHKTFNFFLE